MQLRHEPALNQGVPRKQQTIERRCLEKFRNAYQLPPGTITHGDKPDVILSGARKIGIEVTNLYVTDGSSPASEQVQRQRRIAAVSKAQRFYEQATGNNFQLTFSFDKAHPIQNSAKLVGNLVELARRVEGKDNGQISKAIFKDIPELEFAYLLARELLYPPYVDQDFPDGEPAASKGFAAVATWRNRREARARREAIYRPLQFAATWRVGQGHRFGIMSTERLAEIIRQKEGKARQYSSCDAYWLLVVVDFIDAAQEQEIRLDSAARVASDMFEKVIVYKPGFDSVVEATKVMPQEPMGGTP